jgi:uncharacterized Tic20 family protein
MSESQELSTPPTQPAPPAGPAPMLESEARMWALLLNLAAVAGVLLSGGLLGLAAVLVIWLIFRSRSALIDFHGKQQVNLAISVVIATVVAIVIGVATLFMGFIVTLPLLAAYAIWTIVGSIIAAVKANQGEYYRIALIIPFIK